jgi:hypothetical protein
LVSFPNPTRINAFTLETKTITVRCRLADLPSGADDVNEYTVEFVVSDGEGGAVLFAKTLDDGIELSDEDAPDWEVVLTKTDLETSAGPGHWWWSFERVDEGAGKVIARGPFVVTAASYV